MLKACVMETNETPWASNISTILAKSVSERVRRLPGGRGLVRGLGQFRRRREQAPQKFPMIVVHIASLPNFWQERLPCGGSPGGMRPSPDLVRRWRIGPARRGAGVARRSCPRKWCKSSERLTVSGGLSRIDQAAVWGSLIKSS